MIHNEYRWKAYDGINLYAQSWMPENPARVIINYVHGFKDHSDRFKKWAIRFADSGIGVTAIDLRGHGRSEGRRGYAPNFQSYLKDVNVLRRNSEDLFGGPPQLLYGHSLGGNIVTNYLIHGNLRPKAGIITSPWFTLALKPSWFKIIMAQTARYLLPRLLVQSDIDVQYLSHNNQVVEDYKLDPLVHNLIRPKLFIEIEQWGLKASTSIYKINVPLLVMHGTDDHITSYRQTKNFVLNAGSLTTFKEWPLAYHELHNELEEEKIFNYVSDWINKIFR
jgi:alpha-beta hydrolase superfamily lysophospholipase